MKGGRKFDGASGGKATPHKASNVNPGGLKKAKAKGSKSGSFQKV